MADNATPDGNQTTTVPSTPPTDKMVPERDLVAVKEGLNKQVAELKTELENSKKTADGHYGDLLNERASKEAATRKLEELSTKLAGLETLQTQLTSEIETRKKLESQLLETKRNQLLAEYNIPKEVVADKGAAELELLEQSLRLIGDRKRSGIDGGGGGTGSRTAKTGRELILSGLDQHFKGR